MDWAMPMELKQGVSKAGKPWVSLVVIDGGGQAFEVRLKDGVTINGLPFHIPCKAVMNVRAAQTRYGLSLILQAPPIFERLDGKEK